MNKNIHGKDTELSLIELIQTDKADISSPAGLLCEGLRHDSVTCPLFTVSMSTGSIIAGAGETLKMITRYKEERGIKAEIIQTGSLGLYFLEPVVGIQLPGRNRLLFANISSDKVVSLLDDVLNQHIPVNSPFAQTGKNNHEAYKDIPFLNETSYMKFQRRIILKNAGLIDPNSIEEYIASGGYRSFMKTIRHYTAGEVCDIIENSGLRGRSGSGYPTGKKWKTAYFTSSDTKYLVCNAEESDPGAFMDRTIIEGDPFLLIEGMSITAYAINAGTGIVYLRLEYEMSVKRLRNAINAAREAGLLGHNILGSGFNFDIIIWTGPGAFVCGEETALIASLEGKRGMPYAKPPYPASSGLHHKPTVINNVETLSNIPIIIDNGPKWFAGIGAEGNSGTKLFAVTGKVKFPGVVEVEMGISLKDIVYQIAGGQINGKKIKAVHIGGPSGSIVPAELIETKMTYDALKETGGGIGSGGIVVLDEDCCILDLVKYFIDFMKMQSCGKCIPCREGTCRMAEILESITRKPINNQGYITLERFKGVMQLESLANVMKETSLCGLGQSAPNPVLSSLKHFRDEYEDHIFDRKCRSNRCTEIRTYRINVEICTGCSVCAKKCPAEAIIGAPRHPYFIVEDKCTGCGQCFDSCKFSAIFFN